MLWFWRKGSKTRRSSTCITVVHWKVWRKLAECKVMRTTFLDHQAVYSFILLVVMTIIIFRCLWYSVIYIQKTEKSNVAMYTTLQQQMVIYQSTRLLLYSHHSLFDRIIIQSRKPNTINRYFVILRGSYTNTITDGCSCLQCLPINRS